MSQAPNHKRPRADTGDAPDAAKRARIEGGGTPPPSHQPTPTHPNPPSQTEPPSQPALPSSPDDEPEITLEIVGSSQTLAQAVADAAADDDDEVEFTLEIVGASQTPAKGSTPSQTFFVTEDLASPPPATNSSPAEFVATPATPATTARVTPSAASQNAGHAAARRRALQPLAGNSPALQPLRRRLSTGATPNAQRAARRNPNPSGHSTRARRVSGIPDHHGIRRLLGGDRHDAVGVGARGGSVHRRKSTGGGSREEGNPGGKVKGGNRAEPRPKGTGKPDPPADKSASSPPKPTHASVGGGDSAPDYENVIDVLQRLQSPGNGLDHHLRRLHVNYWQSRVRWSALHRLAIELVRRQQRGRGAVREVPSAVTNNRWANAVTSPNGKRQPGSYLGFRSGDGNATLDRWVAQMDDLVCQALPTEAELDPSPDGTVTPDVQEQAQLLLDRVLVLWNQYLREHGRVVDGFIVDN